MPFTVTFDTLDAQTGQSVIISQVSPGVLAVQLAYSMTSSAKPNIPPINKVKDMTALLTPAQITQLINIVTGLIALAKTSEGV